MSAAVKLSRAEELNSIGSKFFCENQMEPARLHFLAALSLEPNNPQVLQNLGAVLRNLGHVEAALSVAKRSVVASNGSPFAKSNYGVSLLMLRRYDEALTALKEVVRELPNAGHAWHNLGLVQYMMGQHLAALNSFNKAKEVGFDSNGLRSDHALTLLALGRLQEGLSHYECRWDILHKNKIWGMSVPEWKGESLQGRRILVHHEQGYGDSLMLCRFVKNLAEMGAIVTLALPSALCDLAKKNFPFVRVVDLLDGEIAEKDLEFDYHSPLLSVMRWLEIKEPKEIDARPYLVGNPLTPMMMLPDAKIHIGIVWASGDHGKQLRDRRRIVPITDFLPLTEIPGVSLVSLQVDDHSLDIVKNGMEGIVFDVSPKLEDFAATADMIARLQLVISVDSAVCHLAAAMGKHTLMLSPYSRCWRWWNSKSGWPWYERMTIFHQSQNGKWSEAMHGVTRAVRAYMASVG